MTPLRRDGGSAANRAAKGFSGCWAVTDLAPRPGSPAAGPERGSGNAREAVSGLLRAELVCRRGQATATGIGRNTNVVQSDLDRGDEPKARGEELASSDARTETTPSSSC